MLVFGLISPHPPIIIPEVGKDELVKVRQTIEALEAATAQLAQARPHKLIIISPHTDHGFEVPKYYLFKQLSKDIEIEEILVTEPSYQYYYDFGKTVAERIGGDTQRTAIIASGDLSHVLKTDGPYGYDAAGPTLDASIVAAVQRSDAQALLNLDPTTLENGAECGLRSILFLLGAFEGTGATSSVLSYEGPFGVGYMVATLTPDSGSHSDQSPPVQLARESLRQYLHGGTIMPKPADPTPLLQTPAGAFVSLHTANGELRGCIGTILPRTASLAEEIITNAIAAASQDPRFDPVTADELETVAISVDVLNPPEAIADASQLDPKRYGLIVQTDDGRQGLLLPDLEGVDSIEQQIAICREKGSIAPDEPITLARFTSTRYE